MSSRTAHTKAALRSAALDLFERRGYRAVTVDEIAHEAGMSHMTFFRHFPTKESVLLDDPYDPVIASAVAAQPTSLAPIERVARGFLSLAPFLESDLTLETRRGIAIAAQEPDLRAGIAANTKATEDAIVAAVGGPEPATRQASAALLAALMTGIVDWALRGDRRSLGDVMTSAVHVVVPTLADQTVPPYEAGTPETHGGA